VYNSDADEFVLTSHTIDPPEPANSGGGHGRLSDQQTSVDQAIQPRSSVIEAGMAPSTDSDNKTLPPP
jgi:hypothetical protein